MLALQSNQVYQSSALELHAEAMAIAAKYKTCERELFEVITKVEERRIYRQFEIVSLFEYCVELLGLSRHTAYNFIDVVRTANEVPALSEAILSGRTTISKARKICSVINRKNAEEWIELAIHCSTRTVEKAVAIANPRAAIQESMRYVSGDTLELRIAVSEQWSVLLNETKDLLSQRLGRAASTEEALFLTMTEYKAKHDPIRKAERAKLRAERTLGRSRSASKSEVRVEETAESKNSAISNRSWTPSTPSAPKTSGLRSRQIPANVMHLVNLRDRGQCTFVDRHGKRCNSKRWIQLHHREHFANGGEHSVDNLQTLCWAHHCMAHRN